MSGTHEALPEQTPPGRDSGSFTIPFKVTPQAIAGALAVVLGGGGMVGGHYTVSAKVDAVSAKVDSLHDDMTTIKATDAARADEKLPARMSSLESRMSAIEAKEGSKR